MDDISKKLEEISSKLDGLDKRIGKLEDKGTSAFSYKKGEMMAEVAPPPPPYKPDTIIKPVIGSEKNKNFESLIGRWWLGIAGAIVLLLGVAFFLKYAFDNNWIDPTGRVVLGVAAGLALIAGGEYFRNRLAKYSFILTGAGIAILYLTVFAAYSFYQLIAAETAFIFMGLVTLFGAGIAIWADGLPIAMLSTFGGYLTPFLVATEHPNHIGFFTYLAILSAGILVIAFYKKWQPLIILGFLGFVLNFVAWQTSYYNEQKFYPTLYVLVLFFVMHLASGLISNLATKKTSDQADLFIFTVNPAWFFGWCYYLIKSYPGPYRDVVPSLGIPIGILPASSPILIQYADQVLGFLAMLLAALYLGLAHLASKTSEDKKLILFLGAIALVFLTIAVPLALSGSAITIAWGAEALALFALGLKIQNKNLRAFGLIVLVAALLRLFFVDSFYNFSNGTLAFVPILNKRFLTYAATSVIVAVMAYLAAKFKNVFFHSEKGTGSLLAGLLILLTFVSINLEIYGYFDSQKNVLEAKYYEEQRLKKPSYNSDAGSGGHGPVYYYNKEDNYAASDELNNELQSIDYRRNVTLSVFWALYAAILVGLGIARRIKLVRWAGLLLFGLTVLKVLLVDMASVEKIYRIVSFVILGLVLLAASQLYFRFEKKLNEGEKPSV